MGMGPGRGMLGAIIFLNLLATLVTLGIASWAMDELIDRASNQGALTSSGSYQSLAGNSATPMFVFITLIAGVVGVAAIFAALHHFRVWRRDSMATAQATNLIDLMLNFLALGFASKEINLSRRQIRLRVLEAFVIILAGLKLLQVLLVHSSMFGDEFGPRLRDETPGAGMVEPQQKGQERATTV